MLRPLSLLQVVNLAPYNISNPGEPGEIERTCPNIADLDLSNNLMTSWESIAVIGKQLRNLRSLTLKYITSKSLPKSDLSVCRISSK